jgi:hypothetical protein
MLHLRPVFRGGAIALLLSITSAEVGLTNQCIPLKVVDGTGTSLRKKVSAATPGLVTRRNWNTDFAVPNNARFSRYVATLKALSGNGKNFKVQMNLKYPNGTVDETFNGSVLLASDQSDQFTGRPHVGAQPYQINMVVGGIDAFNTAYSLSVVGCP